jgi:ATP-binding cassette subfamily B multidrug efflux pump
MWWHFEESEEGIRRQTIRELLRKVLPLFRPHAKYLYLGFFLLLLITASQLIGPLIIKYIFDTVFPEPGKTIFDLPGGPQAAITHLLKAALLYIAIAASGATVGYYQAISLFRLGINIITDLKSKLFEHILNLGLDFHEKLPPGKLMSRVESDTETFKNLFGDVTVNVLRNLMFFIGILVVLFLTDPKITLWIVLLIPVQFGMTFFYVTKMRGFWREIRAQWAIVIGYVTEYMQGIDVIQQFNYEGRARERMEQVNMGKFKVEMPAMFFEYGYWGLFQYWEILATIIVLTLGVPRVFAGTLSIGTLILFVEYLRQMYGPIVQLSEQISFIQRGLISIERVFGILETEPAVKDGPAPAEELAFEHEIAFENIWFAYEEEHWILQDVSFKIPKGQKVAFVGTSGGGKSTIINLLLRFYDPQKGRITVDGRDIRDFPVKAWRSQIGLVLQDIYLFPGTVADNLRVFNQSVPVERVKETARIAKADQFIERLPKSYDGELTERGTNLSVGERQLMSFARALVYNPPILVLDEATSSVDPHTERMVQEALDRLLAGRTAVIVAHRLSTILNSDRIMLIHDGKVAEAGSHGELLKLGGLYAKLFRLQFADLAVCQVPGVVA